jgi:hypothetical protein
MARRAPGVGEPAFAVGPIVAQSSVSGDDRDLASEMVRSDGERKVTV